MSNEALEMNAYLCVKNMDEAVEFYSRAFGATEDFRLTAPDGRVGHAELHFGEQMLMLSEEFPEMGIEAPGPSDAGFVSLYLTVEDADALFDAALAAGATAEQELQDQFYGHRSGALRDPFGYRWLISHVIEEVTPDEMQNRYNELFEAG